MKRLVFVGVVLLSVVLLGSVLFTARADGSVEILNSSSTVFSSGFETGDYSEWTTSWTEGGGKIGIVSDVSHHGSYSSRANFTAAWQGAWAEIDGLSANPVFIRWYVRFDTLPGNAESFSMAEAVDSSDVTIWDIDIWRNGLGATGIWLYRSRPINTDHYVSYDFEVDKWYCIEVKFYLHASSGEFRVYVNGAEILTVTDVDTSGNAWAGVKLGRGSGFVSSVEVWTDCVQIADAYIGPEDADLVVRGLDDHIYYRIYTSTSGSWENWDMTSGATPDSPAAAEYFDRLHVVVRGTDGFSLWHGWIDLASYSFSGWTMLDGATPSAPTLASNGTALALVVRGLDDAIYYRFYSSGSWGGWYRIPGGTTFDSPAAALIGSNLHVVVRGTEGTSIWHIVVGSDGTVIRDWTSIGGWTPSRPNVASSQGSDTLYLVVQGSDDLIYYRDYMSSSDTWGSWVALPDGATCDGPSVTIMNNTLEFVVRSTDGYLLWHGYVDLTAKTFSGWTLISGSTTSPPTIAS